MRNYIEGIPHSHTSMSSGTYLGMTDSGAPFDLDVERGRIGLTTNGYARRMMDLRIRAAAEARASGRPLGIDLNVSHLAPEESTEITLRMLSAGRVRRVSISINADGSYSAMGGRRSSLREMVREVASSMEAGQGLAPARMRM